MHLINLFGEMIVNKDNVVSSKELTDGKWVEYGNELGNDKSIYS
jgi:hypothetical protein